MSFAVRKQAGLSFLVCEPLERAGFKNAFSTRLGEISFAKETIDESLKVFLPVIDAIGWSVKTAQQTHSDIRVHVDDNPPLEGDALVTQRTQTLIGIKTADCVPVLIGDPVSGVTAAVHAGWRGTLQRIAQKTVSDICSRFSINPAHCIAAIGPSACGDCYDVGPEVVSQFQNEFHLWDAFMTLGNGGKAKLNSPEANRQQLLKAGLLNANIHVAAYCTMHQNDLFFSHRRGGGPGRLLSVIGKRAGSSAHGPN